VCASDFLGVDDVQLRTASEAEMSAAYEAERAHLPPYDVTPRLDDGCNLALSVAKTLASGEVITPNPKGKPAGEATNRVERLSVDVAPGDVLSLEGYVQDGAPVTATRPRSPLTPGFGTPRPAGS
jgi:hypothetical protein